MEEKVSITRMTPVTLMTLVTDRENPLHLPVTLGGETPIKIIHCNLWGDIEIGPFAKAIIDTWEFQRLHYIHQTGVLYKIFPTATTSRFEHAIGSYHVIKRFLSMLLRNQPDIFTRSTPSVPFYLVPIAGLCRNLGYGPFSHLFDRFLETWAVEDTTEECEGVSDLDWRRHDHRRCDIFHHIVTSMTFPYKMSSDEVLFIRALLCPSHYRHPSLGKSTEWIRTLLDDPLCVLDAPMLDYLMRDCASLGMPCGFDVRRIFTNCRVIENRLCFCDRIQDDIWGVLSTRRRLYTVAYHHPKTLEFEAWVMVMFHQETARETFRNEIHRILVDHDVRSFLEWTDVSFLAEWFKHPMWRSLERRVFPQRNPSPSPSPPTPARTSSKQTHPAMDHVFFYHRQRPSVAFQLSPEKSE